MVFNGPQTVLWPVDRNDTGQENVMTEGKSGECPGQERGGP